MTKQHQLIKLYSDICHIMNDITIVAETQRLSNNFRPQFTDEECLTVYLWGIIERRFEVKAIYAFIQDYWAGWFPDLPSYQAFSNRLCNLANILPLIIEALMVRIPDGNALPFHLIDSLPIVVANEKRSGRAKAAGLMCNKGYCDSKKMFYYGVKLHVLGQKYCHSLPFPTAVCLSSASDADLTIAKQHFEPFLHDTVLVGDKAYQDKIWEQLTLRIQNAYLLSPVKKAKGQIYLDAADSLFSAAVSGIRQAIESFFNWLQEKTHIQFASKVRSERGLLLHVFGRFAAALASILI